MQPLVCGTRAWTAEFVTGVVPRSYARTSVMILMCVCVGVVAVGGGVFVHDFAFMLSPRWTLARGLGWRCRRGSRGLCSGLLRWLERWTLARGLGWQRRRGSRGFCSGLLRWLERWA